VARGSDASTRLTAAERLFEGLAKSLGAVELHRDRGQAKALNISARLRVRGCSLYEAFRPRTCRTCSSHSVTRWATRATTLVRKQFTAETASNDFFTPTGCSERGA